MTARRFHLALSFVLALASSCGDTTDLPGGCGGEIPDDPIEVIALYGAAWGESDPAARLCLLERSFAADGVYIDPTAHVSSRVALVEHIESFRGPSASGGIEPSGDPEIRDREGRFGWILKAADGTPLLGGEDWIEFADDGRLSRVHGFFGATSNRSTPPAVHAWQEAWNIRTAAERLSTLEPAVTDDVRFTDGIADVTGREAVADEMERQQVEFGGFEVSVADQVNGYTTASGETYVRIAVEISTAAGALRFTDYARMNGDRIARIAGFPGESLAR